MKTRFAYPPFAHSYHSILSPVTFQIDLVSWPGFMKENDDAHWLQARLWLTRPIWNKHVRSQWMQLQIWSGFDGKVLQFLPPTPFLFEGGPESVFKRGHNMVDGETPSVTVGGTIDDGRYDRHQGILFKQSSYDFFGAFLSWWLAILGRRWFLILKNVPCPT